METLLSIVTWVKTNWTDVASAIAYVIAGASVIVKLTPTTADDTVLNKITSFVGKYIALNK